MSEQYKVTPAVSTAVIEFEKVLLLRRANTGYMDGLYDFPSGHLKPGETLHDGAVRELKEETGLTVEPAHLQLFHIYQDDSDSENPYIFFTFRTEKWRGEPQILEPNKCNEMDFFAIEEPPSVIPHVRKAIGALGMRGFSISFAHDQLSEKP